MKEQVLAGVCDPFRCQKRTASHMKELAAQVTDVRTPVIDHFSLLTPLSRVRVTRGVVLTRGHACRLAPEGRSKLPYQADPVQRFI